MDAFTDGHDRIACVLRWRHEDDVDWRETPMRPLVNDRWAAGFAAEKLGRYRFQPVAWIDRYGTWLHDLERRPDADPDLAVHFAHGAELVLEAVPQAHGPAAAWLREIAAELAGDGAIADRRELAAAPETVKLVRDHDVRRHATAYATVLEVAVDAASSSRSTSRSSARRTTRTSPSTRSGSAAGPTAASSTRRIRRRNTRTSTLSTSSPSSGRRCGASSRA